jgi:anionic cell wall polymer biosynthesis LytR-Cps2A-Psr (LCP) family protein
MATVAYNLGVPVEHYFMVDFQAFTGVIDTLGGITVEVPTISTIRSIRT